MSAAPAATIGPAAPFGALRSDSFLAVAAAVALHAAAVALLAWHVVPELPGGSAPAVAVRMLDPTADAAATRTARLPGPAAPAGTSAGATSAAPEPAPATPTRATADVAPQPRALAPEVTRVPAATERRADPDPRPTDTPRAAPPRAVASAAPAAPPLFAADPAAANAPTVVATDAEASSLPEEPDYRHAATLDPGPRPLTAIDPVYPPEARLQEGVVVLRLLISAEGTADRVDVVRSQPRGLFEASAIEAFGRARYAPGRMLGIPVASQITIEVRFSPVNRGARVTGRTY